MTHTGPPSDNVLAMLASLIGRSVPVLAERSLVTIVQLRGETLCQMGSGTLVAVADHRFLVTAAHVARGASEDDQPLAISGSIDGTFVPTCGRWVSGTPNRKDDPFDIAIYEFHRDEFERFPSDAFVRISDICFDDDLSNKYFVVTGFPAMWSVSTSLGRDTMPSRLLQYGTCCFDGDIAGLPGFDPTLHLLLKASPERTMDESGKPALFRTRAGHAARIPGDFLGVSGGSVWMIGDLRDPPTRWSSENSRLVAVETSIYGTSQGAIRATKWKAVLQLLHLAFPSVRSAIELHF